MHKSSAVAQQAFGLKAKLLHAQRHKEKVQLKKTLKAHDERNVKQADSETVPDGALPTYLLDREGQKDAKALSSALKQKRKDLAEKQTQAEWVGCGAEEAHARQEEEELKVSEKPVEA